MDRRERRTSAAKEAGRTPRCGAARAGRVERESAERPESASGRAAAERAESARQRRGGGARTAGSAVTVGMAHTVARKARLAVHSQLESVRTGRNPGGDRRASESAEDITAHDSHWQLSANADAERSSAARSLSIFLLMTATTKNVETRKRVYWVLFSFTSSTTG